MMSYAKLFSLRRNPQSEPIPRTVPNSAGGHAFPVSDWTRLDRFLVLGSEGGSYYAGPVALTRDNARAVLRCLAEDGPRVVAAIVAVSEAGRAPKQDPAIFALALAASAEGEHALATRRAALAALPRVLPHGDAPVPVRVRRRGDARLGPWPAPRGGRLVRRPPRGGPCLPGGEVSFAQRLVAPRSAAAGSSGDGRAGSRRPVRLDLPRHPGRVGAGARPRLRLGAGAGRQRGFGRGDDPHARPAVGGAADRADDEPGGEPRR